MLNPDVFQALHSISGNHYNALIQYFLLVVTVAVLSGCITNTTGSNNNPSMTNASIAANALSDKAIVQSISYENASQTGPPLVVLPGQFKVPSTVFTQKYTPNNIADFVELELDKANFKVLERAHLGPLLQEVTLSVNMGDPQGLIKFRKGKFLSTRWFVQVDVLRAEPVAKAGTEFDGKPIGDLVKTISGNSIGGRAAGGLISSAGGSEEAQIWIIGLKYKIIDAATSTIVKTGYIEDKMEVGGSSSKFLGISQTEHSGLTIDSMVHRLVQKCVVEIDKAKGLSSSAVVDNRSQLEPQTVGFNDQGVTNYRQETRANTETTIAKDREKSREQLIDSNPNCQELRKNWQLGDSTVMQRYLKECAK